MAKIKHIEFAGMDGGKLKSFYGELFDWNITGNEIEGFDHYDIETGAEPSTGIRHEPEWKPEIIAYIEVKDLEKSVEKARLLGATVRIPAKEYGDLRFAVIADPEVNPIGLTQEKN